MAKKKLFDENGNEVKGKLKKPFYKKVWFWVLAIIVVGAVGGGLGGEENEGDTSDVESKGATATAESTPAAEEEAVFKVGDVVSVGNMEYTVHSIELLDNVGNEYLSQDAQGKYLVVDLTVKNNGNEAVMVDSSFFTLKDGEKTFEADSEASMYANQDESGNSIGFFLENLNPDIEMQGKIVFDVSEEQANSETTQLQATTGAFGTESEVINLH